MAITIRNPSNPRTIATVALYVSSVAIIREKKSKQETSGSLR